ncbi:hypothetical protein NQ317_010103 [Molorchus minor]|uniref:Focal AT domain-containing protein n=1 Tax=Molorchus minor TaxID=1323400 RepID=A0ABQ9IZU7_9CUCU|nr:hypothetical protein NQ317_010103 [Molorchus minor]
MVKLDLAISDSIGLPSSSQHSLYGDQLLENLRYDSSSNFNYELKQKLKLQQLESEEDSKWLAESETHLRLSICGPASLDHDITHVNSNSLPSLPTSPSYVNNSSPVLYQLSSNMTSSGNGNGIHSSTGSVSSSKSHSPLGSLTSTMTSKNESSMLLSGSECSDSEKTKDNAQNPTANLDRSHDRVYECTTDVVRAVMSLSQGVQQAAADQYLDLVGLELRSLLASVDGIITEFPTSAQREVEMAHKVLSKDMAELVNAMKLAQQYSNTTLDAEYRNHIDLKREGLNYPGVLLYLFKHTMTLMLLAYSINQIEISQIEIEMAKFWLQKSKAVI